MIENDQNIMHWAFKKYYPKLQIDYMNDIFINTVGIPLIGSDIKIYHHFFELPFRTLLAMFLHFMKRRLT